MASDQEILQDYNESFDNAYAAWSPFYPTAAEDLRFFLGDQWNDAEKRQLISEGRNAYVFNRIKRNINLVTGYQRKNRLSSVISPVEGSDQLTADQLSECLLYVYQSQDAYNLISDCFGGSCKTGWNLASIYMDYVDDPKDGTIRYCREPYSAFITDPYLTKLDLSDCSYILKRKYISPDQAASLLPGQKKDVYRLSERDYSSDGKFTWMAYPNKPNGQKIVAYTEFYQQKYKDVPMLVDMETGEFTEWDGDKDRLEILKQAYPTLEIVKKPKKYIERHTIINNELMKTDVNPYSLDEYPFVPFVGIFEPESDDWSLKVQSLTRCQIDPQRESNRRRSQMSDIFDSQINSGYIADEDSVVNPQSLFQTSQGKVIWRKQGSQPGAIEKIPPAQIPPSMFQLQELYDRDMAEILGLNDASFGMVESGNESGVMMMLRQSSAIMNLQDVFDNLRLSQKLLSKKTLKLIQTWTPQKIERILNQKPSEQFYNKDFEKYDVSVGEGVLTDSQKMVYFRQLVDLKQLTDVPSQGPITASMLIDAAPIQGKSQLTQQLQQNEQAAQQAQAEQAKQQQELIDAQRQMAQAKAISELALSKERFTRAVANMSLDTERASQAVSDRADATLNRVKAIKELQDMDETRFLRYMAIVRMMEETTQKQEEEITKENVAVSSMASNESLNQLQDRILQQQNPQMQMQQQPMPQQMPQGIG
jgi:hypothetical protein